MLYVYLLYLARASYRSLIKQQIDKQSRQRFTQHNAFLTYIPKQTCSWFSFIYFFLILVLRSICFFFLYSLSTFKQNKQTNKQINRNKKDC